MRFTPASPLSLIAFAAILLYVFGAVLWMLHRSYRSARATCVAALVLSLWIGAQAGLVASGRMTTLPLNGLPLFFAPIVLIWTGLALSAPGRRVAANVPIAALVGFQGFRLPLELVLHAWFKQRTIPEAMTWSGSNWDIVSGVVALVAAPFAARDKRFALVANVVGLVLLLNVMRVAVLSAPVPFGWHVEPPLQLAFHLPYALIGPVCVGGALFGHLVLTRALLAAERKGPGSSPGRG